MPSNVPQNAADLEEWKTYEPLTVTPSTVGTPCTLSGWAHWQIIDSATATKLWRLMWWAIHGSFLLGFGSQRSDEALAAFVYLPEAGLRRCSVLDPCSAGRSHVVDIHPAYPNATAARVVVAFESTAEADAWQAAMAAIARRTSRNARVVFGAPFATQHKIHVDMKSGDATSATQPKNFGVSYLSPEMVKWVAEQGVDLADFRGEEQLLIDCARTLQEGVDTPALRRILQGAAPLSIEPFISPGNPKEVYEDFVKIDSGSQGEVYRARRSVDGRVVAIKRVIVNQQRDLIPITNEVALLSSCRSPHIVELDATYRVGRELYLVMEFMDGGKLTDLLDGDTSRRVIFREKEIASIFRCVLEAVAYLHREGCVHRDIKSDNVLIGRSGEVKLGDFGFAASLCGSKGNKRRTVVGTPYWMAPEVARSEQYDGKADIWSLGILLIELCDGVPPLMGVNPYKAMIRIAQQPPPKVSGRNHNVHPLCQDLIQQLLQKVPAQRPTAEQALAHPFLAPSMCHNSMDFLAEKLRNPS